MSPPAKMKLLAPSVNDSLWVVAIALEDALILPVPSIMMVVPSGLITPTEAVVASETDNVRSAERSPPPVYGAVVSVRREDGTPAPGGTANVPSAFKNFPAAASPAPGAGTAPLCPPEPEAPTMVGT